MLSNPTDALTRTPNALPPRRRPSSTVATAEIKFENYVLSRGGTRLIRKVLIANNGRTSPDTTTERPTAPNRF